MKAEEYFSLATAYFELGKYAEAERWFKLASKSEKTRFASEYNLGRVSFAMGDPEEAARRFEDLLKHDPRNATALRAAAYSWMKAEKWDRALALYDRIADLLPETEDARYNYALALASAGRYGEAIDKIRPYVDRSPDDREALLLLAGMEKKLEMPEAVDHFSEALSLKDEASVRMDYADVLESLQLYARAIENYKAVLSSGSADSVGGKGAVRFRIARVMLLGGEDPEKCLAELSGALEDGYKDEDALRVLAEMDSIPEELKARIRSIADELENSAAESETESLAPEAPSEP